MTQPAVSSTGPRYSLVGYRNRLRMSARNTLLVEGPSDKRAISELIRQVRLHNPTWLVPDINIDSTDIIDSPPSVILGNREKVEAVFRRPIGAGVKASAVGFVDREFRHFGGSRKITDRINAERRVRNIVWSRGHSLENYSFDVRIIGPTMASMAPSTAAQEALDLLRQVFDSVLEIACAMSLAGWETGKLPLVEGSTDWSILARAGDRVILDSAAWGDFIVTRQNASSSLAAEIIRAYRRWIRRVVSAQSDVVRWLCHGHIGMRMIWTAYAWCLFEAESRKPTAARDLTAIAREVRSTASMVAWASQAGQGQAPYPWPVLELLGARRSS